MRWLRSVTNDDIDLAREVAAINAEIRAAYAALNEANAHADMFVTLDGAKAFMARMDSIGERIEIARRRWFPSSSRLMVGGMNGCSIISATGKSIRAVRLVDCELAQTHVV